MYTHLYTHAVPCTAPCHRRHLLKPGGLVLPSSASLHVTALSSSPALSETKASWESVAGFDLTPAMTRVVLTPQVATQCMRGRGGGTQCMVCTGRPQEVHWLHGHHPSLTVSHLFGRESPLC